MTSYGVLGYDEAQAGDPFLKIGVGKLLKGSCKACNATDVSAGGYRFNSPYEFAEEPVWTVVKDRRPYHYVLEHEATLGQEEGVEKEKRKVNIIIIATTITTDPNSATVSGRACAWTDGCSRSPRR